MRNRTLKAGKCLKSKGTIRGRSFASFTAFNSAVIAYVVLYGTLPESH